MNSPEGQFPNDSRALVAIDLGAESCRISLLRWHEGQPQISEVHRISNGPVEQSGSLRWPLSIILSGVEQGLRKAAIDAPEGIASIAVDGWAVDYVRLDRQGKPLHDPFCYRDERTVAAKQRADAKLPPDEVFRRTGAQPLRINTMYQLLADDAREADAPWLCLPEYVLHWLGAPPVAEYTNATHTGLIDAATEDWARDVFARLGLSSEAAPRIVAPGTRLGRLKGKFAELAAFRDTELIAPACHDTASAIAGIPVDLEAAAYICSGTWSLVGTVVSTPITTPAAMAARYTNQAAATGGFCFHSNVNGMWLLKQCMESWRAEGRSVSISDLVQRTATYACAGIINVDAEALLFSGEMPKRINRELEAVGCQSIPDIHGNEARFARVIFESLAARYATAISDLEQMLDRKLTRIHIIGGASRNQLLAELTSQRTGLPVVCGHPESSTIGNFAVQLAASEGSNGRTKRAAIREWAERLCAADTVTCATSQTDGQNAEYMRN